MSVPSRAFVTFTILSLILAGCSSDKSASGPGSSAGGSDGAGSTSSAATEEPRIQNAASTDVTCGSAFRIETIDNGESPRFPMTLNVEQGDVDTSHLVSETNKTSDVMDYNDTFNLTGDVEATADKIDGDALTFSAGWKTLGVTGIPGGDAAAQKYVGKRSDIEVSKTMRPLAKTGKMSDDMETLTTEQIVAASSRYLTPFSEDNVGLGAKWQVWVADDIGTGSNLCTVSTYTLDSFDGTNYAISGSTSINLPEGTITRDQDYGSGIVVTSTTKTSGTGNQTLKASGSLDHFYPDSQQIEAYLVTTIDAVITAGGSDTSSYENITQKSTATYSRP